MTSEKIEAPVAKRGCGRPRGRKRTCAIQARLSPEMFEALERLSKRTMRSKNMEIAVAIRAHLIATGLWQLAEEVT